MEEYLFDLNGYLILKGALTPPEVKACNATYDELEDAAMGIEVRGWHGNVPVNNSGRQEGIIFQQFFRTRQPRGISVEDNIQGHRTAQLLVDNFHTLMNFTVFVKVVDKSIFHLQLCNTKNTDQTSQEGNQQHLATMKLRKAGKTHGHRR